MLLHQFSVAASRRWSTAVGIAALISAVCAPVARAQLQDVKGSQDPAGFKRYEGSTIIGYEAGQFSHFDLLLGPVKDGGAGKRNVLAPTKSERIEGTSTRALYVVPEGRAPLEVLRNYEQELEASGFEVLFRCAGPECGSRDGWLGRFLLYREETRFKQTPPGGRAPGELSYYALDFAKDQHFLAAKRSGAAGDVYASIYVVTGGFPRHKDTQGHALVLLDVIETAPMETKMVKVDAASMAKDIAASGHVALYGIYFDTDKTDIKPESAETLQEIAALLQQDPKLTLYVVGHTDGQGGYDYNIDLSQRRAAAVVKSLTSEHGVEAQRLKPEGVGLLVPVASNDNEEGRAKNRRVELVKQ